ncbi:MAG: HAMP domain-containing histidine kinase [Rickettsiaceae bacterium]|nr:HAMP domain-containing histidine kinase [Rickettsiaceae bacterium]
MEDVDFHEIDHEKANYNVNVRMIAFVFVITVLTLVAIFFIMTYTKQKQNIVDDMHVEWERLETFCQEQIDHTDYILNMLAIQIKKNPNDLHYVKNIFEDFINRQEVQEVFDIDECFWFNNVLNMKVRSTARNNKYISYFDGSKIEFPEKVSYGLSKNNKTIHATIGIKDSLNKYIGSVVVDFDLLTFSQRLEYRKKHEYTNFALIADGYKVIVQSNPAMEEIGLKKGEITNHTLKEIMSRIGFSEETSKEFSYLDMVSGINYYIKKMPNQPFILLVNIDHKKIKKDIFNKVVIKFMEISVFAMIFLILIIAIYQREKWLRTKAEKACEIANRARETKSDFLAFTAHEIRSPLGFIVTSSEVVKKELLGPLPPAYAEYIDGIYKNANLILEFITDILDETQIMEGNFRIVNDVSSIEEIIENAIKINTSRLEAKGSKFQVNIAQNLPKLICDPRRILQVINNLITNSIKYSFQETIITICAKVDGKCLVVEVTDKGVGMTDDDITIALRKYGTVQKKTFHFESYDKSYGLGLAIVKKLLEAHDAKMDITSEVNVGTTVRITFPKYKLVYGKKIDKNKNQDGKQ